MTHNGSASAKTARLKAKWFSHLGIFAIAQAVFALTDNSWALAFLRDSVPDDQSIAMIASRIWLIVFAVDTVWSWWSIADRQKKAAAQQEGQQHPLVTRYDENR